MSTYYKKLILYVCMNIDKILKYGVFKNKIHTHMSMLGILGTKVARGCP